MRRLLVVLVALCVLLPAGAARAEAHTAGRPWRLRHDVARDVFRLLNRQRVRDGLPELVWSPLLARAARRHDLGMMGVDQVQHWRLGPRISASGYPWQFAGENAGYCMAVCRGGARGAALLMERLMDTPAHPEHEAIIRSRTFTAVGVGVLADHVHGGTWLCLDFARPWPAS